MKQNHWASIVLFTDRSAGTYQCPLYQCSEQNPCRIICSVRNARLEWTLTI